MIEALSYLIAFGVVAWIALAILPAVGSIVGGVLGLLLLPLQLIFGLLLLPLKILGFMILLPLRLLAGIIEVTLVLVLVPVLLLVGGALAIAGLGAFGALMSIPLFGIAATVFLVWLFCRRGSDTHVVAS